MQVGSSCFHGDEYIGALAGAASRGVRHFDCAVLYGNQENTLAGMKKAGLKRDEFQITSKVGYFPPDCEGKIYPWNGNNVKLDEAASIDLALKQLGTDYIDLLLIHSPFVGPGEFKAALTPHFFAWGHEQGRDFVGVPVSPFETIDGDNVRELMSEARLARAAKLGINFEKNREIRAKSWEALENAHKAGKAKMIGVSNYPANVLEEMTTYASIMPAVNQIEFHPSNQQPKVLAAAKKHNIQICGYAMCHDVMYNPNPVIAEIGKARGWSEYQVVLRWVNQKGVASIFGSSRPEEQIANLASLEGPDLTTDEVAKIDALDINRPVFFLTEAAEQSCNFKA
jgi:diketogulonate reductase-like aldo/keto reductase